MRPIRIELQGFTSFRQKCEIDFSGLDLFAITGQTGAGKTSLLDAMTYALYGKTSRLNRTGRELVSQGAMSMTVLLHFQVNRREYRVLRVVRGATPTARLERLVAGEWETIPGKIAEIDEQLREIVGLDFNGFTKAVILPQGKFDLFLRGKPDERREVLAELLDLGVYQRMMQIANEASRRARTVVEAKSAEIDHSATTDAVREKERERTALMEQERELAHRLKRLRTALPDALTLRSERAAMVKSEREMLMLEVGITKAADLLQRTSANCEIHQKVLGELESAIRSLGYDGELHLRLSGLEQPARLRKKLGHEREQLESQHSAAEAGLIKASSKLEAGSDVLARARQKRIEIEQSRDRARLATAELRERYGSSDAIEQVIEDLSRSHGNAAEIATLREATDQLRMRQASLPAEITIAKKAAAAADAQVRKAEAVLRNTQKRDGAAALRHTLAPGEPCPVCEQIVSSIPELHDSGELAKAENVLEKSREAWRKAQELFGEKQSALHAVAATLEAKSIQIELHEAAGSAALERASQLLGETGEQTPVEALRSLVGRILTAESAAQRAQKAFENAIEAERAATASTSHDTSSRDVAANALANVEANLKSCVSDLENVERLLEGSPPPEQIEVRLKALVAARHELILLQQRSSAAQSELNRAEELAMAGRKELEGLRVLQAERAKQTASVSRNVAKLIKKLEDLNLAEVPDEATQVEAMQATAQSSLDSVRGGLQRNALESGLLEEKRQRNERLKTEIAQLTSEEALNRDLGSLLNAGHFQQYLLETAFETLAEKGSEHLMALSDERYSFAFDNKEFEIIDHWNAAESRSAQTLSGGESFLASLSLALALADSIADLSGAHGGITLESLFLDEGFSTLDSEMLAKVTDALELLRSGRRLIGIVTHVQALADLMPHRIEIEKTVGGSRIARRDLSVAI